MSTNKHQWAIFYNPRNGRVRVSACAKCGVVNAAGLRSMNCNDVSLEKHPMKKMGWQVLAQQA